MLAISSCWLLAWVFQHEIEHACYQFMLAPCLVFSTLNRVCLLSVHAGALLGFSSALKMEAKRTLILKRLHGIISQKVEVFMS
jgi:hypothetical protein